MSGRLAEQLHEAAAQASVSEEVESDDNLVRQWQDELRDAQEKAQLYREDDEVARAFRADARHTASTILELPSRIVSRRSEIGYDRWANEHLAAFREIPVVSKDRTFASVDKPSLEGLAPELFRAIPLKSALWADWSVWNFRRKQLHRARALPAEAVQRARGSLAHFERLEVWQAVGMADPWLVGVMETPTRTERFYLLYDWGLEGTVDRALLR